jgi:hypothetical protein
VDRVVEQEVEMLSRFGFALAALVVVLPSAGPASAQEASAQEPPASLVCEESAVPDSGPAAAQACASVQIGLAASPNPTPAGGQVTFTAGVYPPTDCWDDLGHSWWGDTSFTMAVFSSFTWTVYCAGDGIQSSNLPIAVDGGGGGGGGGGEVPAPVNLPAIAGTPEVGQTLTATAGSWTNAPTSYTYVWRGSGDLAELGRGPSLGLTQLHVGRQVRVEVLACNGTGCGSWAVSTWTAAVAPPLPVYDPAFVEGTDTDEAFYHSICTGRQCPASLVSGGSATPTSGARCAEVGVILTKRSSLYEIWRMRHLLSFCADRRRITRVWNRIVDGEILIPGWARSVYPWEWEKVTDSPASVNVPSSRSFGRIRFRMCAVFRTLGPLCTINEPWIELTLYADGSALCNASVGRVRNCVIPR